MDRRQRKTQRAIYTAFEDLVSKHHYQEVTVAQIIDRADIGRSTFYAHFETKDDLLHHMCSELFDHIFEGVNTHCVTHAELDAHDLQGRLAHLLYHLRDTHSGICGKLLAENEPIFTQQFTERLEVLMKESLSLAESGIPENLAFGIYTSSFCQTITWWYTHGCIEDPEKVADWYFSLVLP